VDLEFLGSDRTEYLIPQAAKDIMIFHDEYAALCGFCIIG